MHEITPTSRVRASPHVARASRRRTALSSIAAAALVLAGAASTSAYWSATGTAERGATTATLAPPTGVTAPSTVTASEAAGSVPITWTASAGALVPEGYTVTRIDSDGTTRSTVCSMEAPVSSCTDSVAPGSYYYVVTAVYASWTRDSAPSGTVTVDAPAPTPDPGSVNLSQGRATSASSTQESTPFVASNAFDGNPTTRWASASGDPQWIQVDLGEQFSIERVDLSWEAAYATAYEIQVSDTGTGDWRTIYSTTTGSGGTESHTTDGQGRFVRMLGTARATGYGYSLWEFQVFGQRAGILSQAKTASASSVEANTDHVASNAFDGDPSTRWASTYSDPQWVQVDLGERFAIERVDLSWEGAFATAYEIQVSDTGTDGWRTLYSTSTGRGGIESHTVHGEGRFVRMLGTTRATGYGYSLWEFGVFGQPLGAPQMPGSDSLALMDSSASETAAPEPVEPGPTAPDTPAAEPSSTESATTEPGLPSTESSTGTG